ncbi:MAG: hypothetical protein V1912_11360 [bacterium]
MIFNGCDLPSPGELVRAHRTLRRLHRAIHADYDEVRDIGGMPAWDGLVEGERMLAVTTAYLGSYADVRYGAAWERMLAAD